jgi:hypothetical protein
MFLQNKTYEEQERKENTRRRHRTQIEQELARTGDRNCPVDYVMVALTLDSSSVAAPTNYACKEGLL